MNTEQIKRKFFVGDNVRVTEEAKRYMWGRDIPQNAILSGTVVQIGRNSSNRPTVALEETKDGEYHIASYDEGHLEAEGINK